MSEYIINGTSLTNIADAVRSVDGSASTLTPAQMETRLKAVKSSIDSALSALTAKEVEVTSGSTVHALASLIAAIEAGSGGSGTGISYPWLLIGTVTPASSDSDITINLLDYGYDLSKGTYPYHVFYFELGYGRNDTSHTVKRPYCAVAAVDKETGAAATSVGLGANAGAIVASGYTKVSWTGFFKGNSTNGAAPGGLITGNITSTKAELYLKVTNDGTKYSFIPGRTYVWGVIY